MPTSFASIMLMNGLHPPRAGAGRCGAGKTAGGAPAAIVPHSPGVAPVRLYFIQLRHRATHTASHLRRSAASRPCASPAARQKGVVPAGGLQLDRHSRLAVVQRLLNARRVQFALIGLGELVARSHEAAPAAGRTMRESSAPSPAACPAPCRHRITQQEHRSRDKPSRFSTRTPDPFQIIGPTSAQPLSQTSTSDRRRSRRHGI